MVEETAGNGGVAEDTVSISWPADKKFWKEVWVFDEPEENSIVIDQDYNPDNDSYGYLVVKLDPEFKEAWIKALRSGRYKQTTSLLRGEVDVNGEVGTGFCCLGVACDIVKHDGWSSTRFRDDQDFGTEEVFDEYSAWVWEDKYNVQNNSTAVPFVADNTATRLAELNDGGDDFEMIADWIEENL